MMNYGEKLTVKAVIMEIGENGLFSGFIRKLGNNTFNITYPNGDRVVRYHHTNILFFKANRDIVIDTRGWMTVTTKDRLRAYLPKPWAIRQANGLWYLWNKETGAEYLFKDGITIHPNGSVGGDGGDKTETSKMNEQIKVYVRGFVKALVEGKIPQPSAGDCLYCGMRVVPKAGERFDSEGNRLLGLSLGEATESKDHLVSHFEEKYYVPSMIVNAIEIFPVSDMAKSEIGAFMGYHVTGSGEWGKKLVTTQLGSSLRLYLRRCLGMAY